MKIILASKSPRRKELLTLITNNFEVMASDDDEVVDSTLSPDKQVEAIASKKAHSVAKRCGDETIIIGSDTIVVVDNEILGKPRDNDEAVSMLKKISGRAHDVMTGISIIIKTSNKVKEIKDVCVTKVYVKELTNDEIKKWIDTGKALDKAGAYAIQQEFAVHIEKIEGNFSSVVGLPINKVYDIIKEYI